MPQLVCLLLTVCCVSSPHPYINKIASAIAGGVFYAFAFAGAGWLFSKLNHKGYKAEIKRHNHSLEQLAKDKQKWYQEEVRRKDHIAELKEQLAHANSDINATNRALIQLKKYEDTVNPEPVLSDYYQPSDEMKHYQTLAVGALGLASGMGLVKVLGAMLV